MSYNPYEYDKRQLLRSKDRLIKERHTILNTGAIQRVKTHLYTGDHITYGYMGCPRCNGTGEYGHSAGQGALCIYDQCPRCLAIHKQREATWYRGV